MKVSPSEILESVANLYASCKTYSDSGTVFFNDINRQPERIDFQTKFVSPDRLRYEWQDYGPGRGKSEKFSKLVIIGDLAELNFTWDYEREVTTRTKGISGVTGCSAGAALIILPMLMTSELPDKSKHFLGLSDLVSGASEDCGTEPDVFKCHVIDGVWFNDDKFRLWVDESSLIVRCVRRFEPMFGPNTYCFPNVVFDEEISSDLFEFNSP